MFQKLITFFKTWISIDFNQDSIQLLIEDKVITKQLEGMLLAYQFALYWLHGVANYLDSCVGELLIKLALASSFSGGAVLGKVAKEGIARDDVALFELPIVIAVLLDGIVRQLHENLVLARDLWVVFLILLAAGSDVALAEDVDLAVTRVKEHPHSDIILAL